MLRFGQLALISLLLVSSVIAADESPKATTWTFESDPLDAEPAGFRTVAGTWAIASADKGMVLRQTARSADSVFNVLVRTDVLYEDVDLQVRLKAVDGVVDQGGGVVWRVKNGQTYYVSRYNPLEDSFRFYKVVDGKRFQLGSVKAPGDQEWHTLRIIHKGSKISCRLDEKITIDVEDNSIRGPGRVGLWSKADAQSLFDDLQATGTPIIPRVAEPYGETKEFEIRSERPYLGGKEIDLWGIRCGNAFVNDAVTERFVRNFDNMNAHGINLFGAYIQGTNAGFPSGDAGYNGYTRHGEIKPEVARRIEFLVREADKRGMVVMIGCITPRKDQDFYDESDMRKAIEETARFLKEKKLRNVFVNLCDEFNHPLYAEKILIREPDGAKKKDQMTAWFKAIAPDIEVGVGPHWKSGTDYAYPTQDLQIMQKGMAIPRTGFAINVEPTREDYFNNDGIFNATNIEAIFTNCRNYLDAPNACFMFHSGFIQGVTNFSGTAPHAEMGGYGTGQYDRGVRFYYEWVRDNVGVWEYPRHVPAGEFSIHAQPQGN